MKKLLLICLSLSAFNLYAADGSSGCGPGWYVTQKNSILSSAIRATTNALLAPTVTIGMTFGTSNCTKHSIVKKEQENLKFATDNYFEIAADTAKGSGNFLAAYSNLMGCRGDAGVAFQAKMQKNFNQLFDSNQIKPEHLVEETYKVILRDESLVKSCFKA